MNFLKLIEQKRDGGELSPEAIADVVAAFAAGSMPDYQMAAFLMAVQFQGMTLAETRALTLAMRDSGEVLEFPEDDRPLVDKHSTGGVGDKVSLPLAPLLACLGYRVPMISGRGLGITGGTLDKLESIPGFTTQLSAEQLIGQVQQIGVALGGQTSEIAPADKALYALRDVTGTVPSVPLITASILSKKLAENLDALVMDVKFGAAAFMRTRDDARALAKSIVTLATECGVQTTALITNMDAPLGRAAGNWLEVKESIACLEGNGPNDLEELVIACAAQLPDCDADRARAELASGRPREKFNELLTAQGADRAAFETKLKQATPAPTAPIVRDFPASGKGFLARCDARIIGEVVRDLGGGRQTKDSEIQPDVGLDQMLKPGEAIDRPLCRIHATTEAAADAAAEQLAGAFEISGERPDLEPLICGML
ncbi:MAG: thymidine phosphorylase [Verrucomicrobia subdivision 3 bacterium]|nr:thymidine phosphorylase [Limisphaerales bacterium]